MLRLSLLAGALLFAVLAAASPVDTLDKRAFYWMGTPSGTMLTCTSVTWSWYSSAAPPFTATVTNTVTGAIYAGPVAVSASSYTWKVNVPANTKIAFQLSMSDGSGANIQPWTVSDGSDTSCILCPGNQVYRFGICDAPCADPNAATCGPGGASVITCKPGYKLLQGYNACVSTCPSFSYDNNAGSCIVCTGLAATCTSATVATSCKGSSKLYNGVCYATCPSGTYATSSTTCGACGSLAATCDSPTAATSCTGTNKLYGGVCYSACPQGTFASSSTTCTACANTALSCTSATVATECKEGNFLASDGSCSSICSGAFFPNSSTKKCEACSDAFAASCSADKSLTCQDGHYLIESTSTCSSGSSCPDATYLNSDKGSCVSCDIGVATCTSSEASSCLDGWLLYKGQCLQGRCIGRTYQSGSECFDCKDKLAQTCTADASLTCQHGHFLVESTSRCTESTDCPTGTWFDEVSGVCKSCQDFAATCSSASVALSCVDEYYLKDGSCTKECGDGFFADASGEIARCAACAPTALKCTSATAATECKDENYLASDGSCGSTCSGASFANSSNKKCDACTDSFAASCSAAGSLSCQDGHYLVASTLTCTADASCPAATFLDDTNKTCVSCSENAATCTASAATSCSGDYVLYQGACASKFCPTSFFNQDGVCTGCKDSYAATCTADKSVTCLTGHKLMQSTSTCTATDACPSATYDDRNGVCVSCSANSASCISSGSTACSGEYVLYNKACAATSCPSGFFNKGGICTACSDPNAATCTSDKTLTCQSGHLLVASTGKCTTTSNGSCPATMYKDGSNCKACTMAGAYTCTATAATSCYQPASSAKTYLLNGKCVSENQCRLNKLLLLAWLKPTTQTDGTVTYECTTCPAWKVPNPFDASKCIP